MDALLPAPPRHGPDLRAPRHVHKMRGSVVPYYGSVASGSPAAQALMSSQWVPRASGVLRGYGSHGAPPANMHKTPQPEKSCTFGLWRGEGVDAEAIVEVFHALRGDAVNAMKRLRDMDQEHADMRAVSKMQMSDVSAHLIAILAEW